MQEKAGLIYPACFYVICNLWSRPVLGRAGSRRCARTHAREGWFLRIVPAQRPSYCEYYARKTSGRWAPCVLSPVCTYKRGFCPAVAGRVYRGNGLISPARVYTRACTCTCRFSPLNKRPGSFTRAFFANGSIQPTRRDDHASALANIPGYRANRVSSSMVLSLSGTNGIPFAMARDLACHRFDFSLFFFSWN